MGSMTATSPSGSREKPQRQMASTVRLKNQQAGRDRPATTQTARMTAAHSREKIHFRCSLRVGGIAAAPPVPVAAVSVACVTFMPDLHHGFRCGGASRLSESGVGSWNGKSKSGANMDIYFLLCIISVLLFSIPNTLFFGLVC